MISTNNSNPELQMELPPRSIHFFPFMEPFILPKLCVKSSLLKPSHFQSKPRSQFLQPRLCLFLAIFFVDLLTLFEDIPGCEIDIDENDIRFTLLSESDANAFLTQDH